MVMPTYERAKTFSEKTLEELRSALSSTCSGSLNVLTFGSYARREASPNSDLDFLLVVDGEDATEEPANAAQIRSQMATVVPIQPGLDGPFGGHVSSAEFTRNIGGNDDTNKAITRRILLLLEGDWLSGGNDSFRALRRSIITRYVEAIPPKDHQLALLLLNDIIRYWRTITVDYAFKVIEEGKDWGLRNIKLMYSRKMMYASGLFGVALTADRSCNRKIDFLDEYFAATSIERIVQTAGAVESRRVMELYDQFLGKLEQKSVRDHLKALKPSQRDDPVFRELKNEGHRFTRELLNLFEKTFHSTHLIHRAVIF